MNTWQFLLNFFLGIFTLSCQQKHDNFLTEEEQYELLNDAFIPYLDSIHHPNLFYDHFSATDTSLLLEKLVAHNTEELSSILVFDTEDTLIRKEPTHLKKIKTEKLHGMNFVNWAEIQSIKKSTTTRLLIGQVFITSIFLSSQTPAIKQLWALCHVQLHLSAIAITSPF